MIKGNCWHNQAKEDGIIVPFPKANSVGPSISLDKSQVDRESLSRIVGPIYVELHKGG